MIKVGDKLPAGNLQEFVEVEGNGCSIGPNTFDVAKVSAGKTIAIFGLPGAFTPTCSAKHVPGYVEEAAALKAAGVDEVWCVSVNDAFVMGAWARDQKTSGRFLWKLARRFSDWPWCCNSATYSLSKLDQFVVLRSSLNVKHLGPMLSIHRSRCHVAPHNLTGP